MKNKDWKYRSRTEREYEKRLTQVAKSIADKAKGAPTIEEIVAALMAVTEKSWFLKFARTEAKRMVKSVLVENAQTWREAARKGTKSRQIHQALKKEFDENERYWELINKNAQWIKTIPDSLATSVVKKAGREAMAGRRDEDIIQTIRTNMPGLAEYKARRIARTEVAKAQATITQVRAQALGVEWYVWRTSRDQRVRSSHEHMEGVLINFNNPPSPEALIGENPQGYYNAGNIYNCRCYAEPLLDESDFEPNSKVYYNGTVQRMSKKRFLEIAN